MTNGKKYVGQTIHSAQERFTQHCKPSETNCRLLNRAIAAHGKENFTVSVLESVTTVKELDEREMFWIAELGTLSPNGYNLNGGGNGKGIVSDETKGLISATMRGKMAGNKNPFYGKTHTEETRRKMRENHWDMRGEMNPNYGKNFSAEHRRKLSEAKAGEKGYWYGKHLPEETRAKISAANKGRVLSEDALRRMAETKRGKKPSEETRKKLSDAHKGLLTGGANPMAKAVVCIETGEIYASITEAAKAIGVRPESLSNHIRGKTSCCGKRHWKYVD